MAGGVAVGVEVIRVASDNVEVGGVAGDVAARVEVADDVAKRDTFCCLFLCFFLSQFFR